MAPTRWLVAAAALATAAGARSDEAAPAVDLFVDGGKTFVRAGSKDGLAVGTAVTVVGAPDAAGQRPTLGSATVMEVFPAMARVSLDRSAQSAAGDKWAVLPAARAAAPTPRPRPAAPPAAAVPSPQPASGAALKGRAEITSFVKRVKLYNQSDAPWRGCELKLNDGRRYRGFKLAPWRHDTVRLGAFVGPETDLLPLWVDVTCAEGSARFHFGT